MSINLKPGPASLFDFEPNIVHSWAATLATEPLSEARGLYDIRAEACSTVRSEVVEGLLTTAKVLTEAAIEAAAHAERLLEADEKTDPRVAVLASLQKVSERYDEAECEIE